MLEARHGERDFADAGAAGRVNDRDRVVRGIRHIHSCAARHQRARAGAPDGCDVVAIDADQIARLDPLHDAPGRELHAEDRHRVGMIRASEPRHVNAVHFDPVFGFLRRHAVRGKRQPLLGSVLARHAWHKRVLEHPDVRNPRVLLVRRQRHREWIPPDAHRLDDLPRLEIDGDEAIVELIDDEEAAAIAAEGQVAGKAVLEAARVEVDRAGDRGRRNVEHDDAAFVRAAVVEAGAVRRERAAHVRSGAGFRVAGSGFSVPGSGFEGRHAAHRVRFAQIDELERVLVQDRRARSVGAERQSPRVGLRAQDTSHRRHVPAVHEDGRVALDARPCVSSRRLEPGHPRRARGSTARRGERC